LHEASDRTAWRSGVPITELRVAGGGSQSDAALQLTADVFGLHASRPHVYEASGLGAAMDMAVDIGIHKDFSTAIREMTHIRDTFEPDKQTHIRYDELYRGVYKKMYDRLKPLYESMPTTAKIM
jgi:sugar (pentulose or hexulose) kinase